MLPVNYRVVYEDERPSQKFAVYQLLKLCNKGARRALLTAELYRGIEI